MEVEKSNRLPKRRVLVTQPRSSHLFVFCFWVPYSIICKLLLSFSLLLPLLLHLLSSPNGALEASDGPAISKNSGSLISKLRDSATSLISKLWDSVTFLPLKDLRCAETSMVGNTWFMSSLDDTCEANEAEYLYDPSQTSKGGLICIKGCQTRDGTKNSYALRLFQSLPRSWRAWHSWQSYYTIPCRYCVYYILFDKAFQFGLTLKSNTSMVI